MGRGLLMSLGITKEDSGGTREPRKLLSRTGTSGYHRLGGQGMHPGGDGT